MADDDYPVGYKKPPKSTQFQPGESGNPKGRPKGVKNLASDLAEELEQFVVVHEGSQTLKVTKQRAMLKSLFAKAMKGDVRASSALITLILGLEQSKLQKTSAESLAEDDLEILEAFKQKILNDSNESGDIS
jgi:hypothetical protein